MDAAAGLRWRTAVHECGHALVALMLGRGATHVALFESGGICATRKCDVVPPPEKFDNDKEPDLRNFQDWRDAFNECVLTAAGYSAENLTFSRDRKFAGIGESSDKEVIKAVARKLLPGLDLYGQTAFCHLANAEARRLLRKSMWRVRRAAKALDKAGELTPDEVVAALYPDKIDQQPNREETNHAAI